MIRIDEIYHNVFWPYIKKHMPLTRMFFCDPPGRTDPESLFNFGVDTTEFNYIFLHDQEPIHLDIHKQLFDQVQLDNADLNNRQGATHAAIITSEFDSEFAEIVAANYDWNHYTYFYHGWAAMDWYRGYDRSYLMPEPETRQITHSFISPNRIIGGRRDHRVLLMYHLLKKDVRQAHISFPETCPVEQHHVRDISSKFLDRYPDIQNIFDTAHLPRNFAGETGHPMHSCWLSLFDQVAETLAYVVTETVCFGRRHHLTEKVFKPICQQIPFVLVSTHGSLAYLRKYGFQTFGSIWDESYDDEIDDHRRIEKVADLLAYLDSLSPAQMQDLYLRARPIVQHNFQHFYQGGFEAVLAKELETMLAAIKKDFS